MLRSYIKWTLFFSSYIPLYITLLILQWPVNRIVLGILIAFIVLPLIVLLITLKVVNKFGKTFTQIKNVNYKNSEFVGYIFTYILPFISGDFSQINNLLAVGVLYILIGFLYVRSNLLYTNPILNLLGYHLYEVDDDKNNHIILITKRENLYNNLRIKIIKIAQNVYLGE